MTPQETIIHTTFYELAKQAMDKAKSIQRCNVTAESLEQALSSFQIIYAHAVAGLIEGFTDNAKM